MSNDRDDRVKAEIERFRERVRNMDRLDPTLVKALADAHVLYDLRLPDVAKAASSGRSIEEIVAQESAVADGNAKAWSFDKAIVNWSMKTSPFLNEFSRWIRKRASAFAPDGKTPNHTAMATYNPATEELEVLFNPAFVANVSESFMKNRDQTNATDAEGGAVYEHEMSHIVFCHVTSRAVEPYALSNIAMDLAINSLIARGDTPSKLSTCMLLPGVPMSKSISASLPAKVKEATESISRIIASLPPGKASEWYFEVIKRASEQQGIEWGARGIKIPGSGNPEDQDGEWEVFGDLGHGGWSDVPEELRGLVESKVKHAMREACRKADNDSSGWGNIPVEMRQEIRRYCFGHVDWETLLQWFCGSTMPSGRHRSMKRIDRKAPYVSPGLRRMRTPSILVMVDQSASVGNDSLELAFGAIGKLSRKTTFDVVAFDEDVAKDSRFTWRRGTTPQFYRVKCGGTNFDNAIRYANAPENRGRYDGIIVITDGECSRSVRSRVKLAWLVVPGRKLMFEPANNEILVQMEKPGE